MSWQDTGYSISYARDLSYYELQEMKESVRRCHILFERQLFTFDTMYLLRYWTMDSYREIIKWSEIL